jgi:hypothetical protein
MYRARKIVFLLTVVLLSAATGHAAGLSFSPRGLDSSVVEIEIKSFVDTLPERGVAELWVEVRNRRPEDASWEFHFNAYKRNWGDHQSMTHSRRVSVDGSSVRTFRFQVPLYPSMQSSYSEMPRLGVRIRGPGTFTDEQYFFQNSRKNSGDLHRYVLVSEGGRALSDGSWWNIPEMEKQLRADNVPLSIQEMDPDLFPDTLAPLSGFDLVVMQEAEWMAMDQRRTLLRHWVAQGGHLMLLSDQPDTVKQLGLGTIETLNPPGDLKELIRNLTGIQTLSQRVWYGDHFYEDQWELREHVPDIRKPVGMLMLLVIAVAGVLGPLNLLVAFRRRQSLQVLWTTPLLSFGISLLVGVVILLGDGLGGKGARAHWVMILPEENLELSWQEQVSRTGVLPSSRFQLTQGWSMRPVPAHRNDKRRTFSYSQQPGGEYSGGWFRNRTVQAQVLRRVQTTRAGVHIRWQEGTPRLRSTVETPFARILYTDSQGRLWGGERIEPGKEVTLSPRSRSNASELFEEMKTHDTSLFPGKDLLGEREWFYAEGLDAGRMVDTLGSISWQDRPVWFMGPVEEEGP